MMPATPTPGTAFVIAIILLVVVGTIGMVVLRAAVWLAERRELRYVMSNDGDFEDMYEDEPEPPRSIDIPHMNHVEPSVRGSLNQAELRLNADEVAAVARMIEHNKTAVKPSKSSTIQAGFGVSRGGSQLYVRASAIYDAFFGAPTPAVPQAQYMNPDGTLAPPTYPVSGRQLRSRPTH
jgi:hypothetical protein